MSSCPSLIKEKNDDDNDVDIGGNEKVIENDCTLSGIIGQSLDFNTAAHQEAQVAKPSKHKHHACKCKLNLQTW